MNRKIVRLRLSHSKKTELKKLKQEDRKRKQILQLFNNKLDDLWISINKVEELLKIIKEKRAS
jgi:hypothetical protein